MRISIKKVKDILTVALTSLMIVVLFGVIFVSLDLVELTWGYILECFVVVILTVEVKILWYPFGEERRKEQPDLEEKKAQYYRYVDANITDVYDFDTFLKELNQENKDNYVANKMGSRTRKNTPEAKYNKLYFKYLRRADKLREVKSSDIIELTNTKTVADTRNYTKQKKIMYQTVTTLTSAATMIGLATIAFEEMMLNPASIFRFVTYIATIGSTLVTTIYKAYTTYGTETLDHLARCSYVVKRYISWKEGKAVGNSKPYNEQDIYV